MKTLEITKDESKAFEMLGELAGAYGDNGSDPDGNAWLPFIFIDEEDGENVITAGLGRMVHAVYLEDAEIAKYLKIEDVLALAEETDDWEAFQNAVEDKVRNWAHYNAYGTNDSTWVIVPRR